MDLDADDRRILALIQEEGILNPHRIRTRLGLSQAQSHRRLRRLEASGAIERYTAVLCPEALGLRFEARAFAVLAADDELSVRAFERAVFSIPHIVQAERLGGDIDYLLHVRTTSRSTCEQLVEDTLHALPGLAELTWAPVASRLRSEVTLPI
ncbi:Lrp/AsnC family transcriptional regulator [Brachybacterium hainanense]|uniref:Lrp/AsnC family transcriptional regulator n=1 Tax=Brachybacterium hainanense TaxID=1541174 RepID=A0ABV6REH7_9MICO